MDLLNVLWRIVNNLHVINLDVIKVYLARKNNYAVLLFKDRKSNCLFEERAACVAYSRHLSHLVLSEKAER